MMEMEDKVEMYIRERKILARADKAIAFTDKEKDTLFEFAVWYDVRYESYMDSLLKKSI